MHVLCLLPWPFLPFRRACQNSQVVGRGHSPHTSLSFPSRPVVGVPFFSLALVTHNLIYGEIFQRAGEIVPESTPSGTPMRQMCGVACGFRASLLPTRNMWTLYGSCLGLAKLLPKRFVLRPSGLHQVSLRCCASSFRASGLWSCSRELLRAHGGLPLLPHRFDRLPPARYVVLLLSDGRRIPSQPIYSGNPGVGRF